MSEPTPTAEMLMAKVSRLPFAAQLADDHSRRKLVYERMAASSDPVTREIGRQLRDGAMRVRDMWAVPEYRQVLERGLRNLESFDVRRFNEELDSVVADYEREREDDPYAADEKYRRYLEPSASSDDEGAGERGDRERRDER